MKRWMWILVGAVVGVAAALTLVYLGVYAGGELEQGGEATEARMSPEVRSLRAQASGKDVEMKGDAPPPAPGQVLFGDLHVHTTFSTDAFVTSLPFLGGEGAHPPADACDFARFCAALDFYALTDHAEALTPHHWEEIKRSVRQCNGLAGDPADPDIVAYTGWEWSQVGRVPEEHFGHKNVIFEATDDASLPARPIGSQGLAGNAMAGQGLDVLDLAAIPWREHGRRQRYLNLAKSQMTLSDMPFCESGVDTRQLPADCREVAADPQTLFRKLDQWGVDTLVIPHGTTWGFYTPPGYTWDKQLAPAQSDPELQRLIEVYSGHGNSEEYRDFRAVAIGPDGEITCPEPSEGYEPCCHRAGEIIRSRCEDPDSRTCQSRVEEARLDHARAGIGGHLTVPGASVEDWQGCGQCRDCELPSYGYRPAGSAQYILARGHFEEGAPPRHETFGFIASSDNHGARPGTGYKEVNRRRMTEATGPISPEWDDLVLGPPEEPLPESRSLAVKELELMAPHLVVNAERQASFFMTGGLVAVHSDDRSREAIWEALKERRVYGTSGPRILLWFDAVQGEDRHAMGSTIAAGTSPRFEVRALGAFEQAPGCPDSVVEALGEDGVERLCGGECFRPGESRHPITYIEVIRVLRQRTDDEPVASLIEDPWKRLPCEDEGQGCRVTFEDLELAELGRDVLYYVRAIQAPTPAVNAANLRCADDACEELDPCYGDYRTSDDDDCLSPAAERAWSSPIYVTFDPDAVPPPDESGDAEGEGADPEEEGAGPEGGAE